MNDFNDLPALIYFDAEQVKQTHLIEKDEVIIGREQGSCDIVIDNRQVSRRHARVYRDGEVHFIQDLNSRNGTKVNDRIVEDVRPLADQDRVELAPDILFVFYEKSSTIPVTPIVPATLSGRFRLDAEARRVFINDIELDPPLSPPQYRLLELLVESAGRICTREQVIEAVWPEAVGDGVSEQAIDALVRRLRDRMNDLNPDWQYVLTVRGHGFRFNS